jgi:hypothetical protein
VFQRVLGSNLPTCTQVWPPTIARATSPHRHIATPRPYMELTAFVLLLCFIALVVQIVRGGPRPQPQQPAGRSSMGCASSQQQGQGQQAPRGGGDLPPKGRILDNYRTLAEVEGGLRKAGLESSDLVLASVGDTAQRLLLSSARTSRVHMSHALVVCGLSMICVQHRLHEVEHVARRAHVQPPEPARAVASPRRAQPVSAGHRHPQRRAAQEAR